MIRNISVLVSQLENVSRPEETNHIFCVQASKAIGRKLDSILDSSTTLSPRAGLVTGPERNTATTIPQEPDDRDVEAGIVEFSELDNLDFSAWVIDFDLVTGHSVWDTTEDAILR